MGCLWQHCLEAGALQVLSHTTPASVSCIHMLASGYLTDI